MDPTVLVAQFNHAHLPSPVTAANPSPGGASAPPPSHPSYVEMITAAIQWENSQGKEGGSSKRAIAKYIDRAYTNLPASHSALLTYHLKRLKNSGDLVMVKNSYQLPSAISPPPPSPPSPSTRSAPPPTPGPDLSGPVDPSPSKRRPGRPPKQKVVAEMQINSDLDTVVDNGTGPGSGSEPSKKRRGRPPKRPQEGAVATEVPFYQPSSEVRPTSIVNGEASLGGQKKRGRPPMVQSVEPVAVIPDVPLAPEAIQVNEEVTVKRRPGRPPKKASSEVVKPNMPDVEGSVRSRGRPKKNVLGPVVSHKPVGKRPRGRPKVAGAVSGGGALGVGIRLGIGMRRGRGRPPKGGGLPMVRRSPGRPTGHPKKDTSVPRSRTAGQEVANEELLRKFELIQSKIQEAVIVLRPCVADESPALMALQQLEEMATMDLTTPPNAPLPPPEMTMPIPQSNSGGPPPPAVPVSIAPASNDAPFMDAPFDGAPSGMEAQHPMNWFLSNEAQSQ